MDLQASPDPCGIEEPHIGDPSYEEFELEDLVRTEH